MMEVLQADSMKSRGSLKSRKRRLEEEDNAVPVDTLGGQDVEMKQGEEPDKRRKATIYMTKDQRARFIGTRTLQIRQKEQQQLSSDEEDDNKGLQGGKREEDSEDNDSSNYDGDDKRKSTDSEDDTDVRTGFSIDKRNDATMTNDDEDELMQPHGEDESDGLSDFEAVSLSLNTFKTHMEYFLTENEALRLSKGQAKFKHETLAVDLEGGKWTATTSEFPSGIKELMNFNIKLRLRKQWLAVHKKPLWGDFQSHQQCQFFTLCNSYCDIMHTRRQTFYASGDRVDTEIMDAYLLHLLNHVLKTRDLVIKNNDKRVHSMEQEIPRDQGFTRPKVLILLPLRSFALRVVKRMLDLIPLSQKVNIEQHARFVDEFGVEDDGDDNDKKFKPADFKALFGGNNDDHFRIGLKFTRKSVKLFSDFYSSDVIVASPLGLITRIGEAEHDKDKDVDFLSSIEMLIIDYADVILMQNWSHVEEIAREINCIPAQQHGVDFMRIREWILNGHACYYRQTILLSAFPDPGMNAFFHRSCFNFAGKVKLKSEYSGVLSKIALQVRQVYECIGCRSLTEVDDARFQLFIKQVIRPLKETFQSGIMVFMSSYFDFVRLRNYLKAENMSFCLLGEYTKQSDISRARAWFFHGKCQIMLYTERAHFYHRYKIRGIKELIFYSLPEHEEFYVEIVNMMEGLGSPTLSVLFSRFDKLKLERVVGTSRAKRMLNSENRTFMFF